MVSLFQEPLLMLLGKPRNINNGPSTSMEYMVVNMVMNMVMVSMLLDLVLVMALTPSISAEASISGSIYILYILCILCLLMSLGIRTFINGSRQASMPLINVLLPRDMS